MLPDHDGKGVLSAASQCGDIPFEFSAVSTVTSAEAALRGRSTRPTRTADPEMKLPVPRDLDVVVRFPPLTGHVGYAAWSAWG